MKTPDDSVRQHAWTRYWHSGALHSCATSYSGNYGGAVRAYWNNAFGALEHGSRVLDAAAGNGALAQLLLSHCADPSVSCDAVDRAVLAPAWIGQDGAGAISRVRFHPDTPLEALPFADDTFALIVSQYGIEYSDLDRTIPELQRVARKPGRIALVAHHAASRPVELAREEISHIEWLLEPSGFLELGQALLEPLTLAQTQQGRAALARSPDADRLRTAFNEGQQALSTRIAGAKYPDVLHEVRDAVGRVIRTLPSLRLTAANAYLDTLRANLEDGAVRLADLLACALSPEQIRRLGFALSADSRIDVLYEGDALMGWTVQGNIR